MKNTQEAAPIGATHYQLVVRESQAGGTHRAYVHYHRRVEGRLYEWSSDSDDEYARWDVCTKEPTDLVQLEREKKAEPVALERTHINMDHDAEYYKNAFEMERGRRLSVEKELWRLKDFYAKNFDTPASIRQAVATGLQGAWASSCQQLISNGEHCGWLVSVSVQDSPHGEKKIGVFNFKDSADVISSLRAYKDSPT